MLSDDDVMLFALVVCALSSSFVVTSSAKSDAIEVCSIISSSVADCDTIKYAQVGRKTCEIITFGIIVENTCFYGNDFG